MVASRFWVLGSNPYSSISFCTLRHGEFHCLLGGLQCLLLNLVEALEAWAVYNT